MVHQEGIFSSEQNRLETFRHAAETHRRAAQLHEQAAALFERFNLAEAARREHELVRREIAGAEEDERRADGGE